MDTPAVLIAKVAFVMILLVVIVSQLVIPITGFVQNETNNKTAAIFGGSSINDASISQVGLFANFLTVLPYALIIFAVMYVILHYIEKEQRKSKSAMGAKKWYTVKRY